MNRRIKQMLLISIACVFLLTFACAGVSAEPLAGGWTLFSDFPAVELPEALRKGFEENFGLVGASYQPILYLGTQVVAGVNHLVLCRITLVTAEPIVNFALVVIYEDFGGEVTVSSVSNVDLLSLIE